MGRAYAQIIRMMTIQMNRMTELLVKEWQGVFKVGFEAEDETGTIEINFNDGSVKGKCKAGDWEKHFKKVRDVIEGA